MAFNKHSNRDILKSMLTAKMAILHCLLLVLPQLRFLRALDQSSLCGAATAPVDLITDKYGEVYKVRGMTQVVWHFVVNCESLGAYLLELNDNKVS